jgi:hypothetical protein
MSEEPIVEIHPDVIIDGEPFEVISKVTDEHGVVWVEVEHSECRLQRISVRREAGGNGRKQQS